MKYFSALTSILILSQITLTFDQPQIQQIVIPKPQQQQCQYIQGVGNPIKLLKVLIDVINKSLATGSQAQVTLIHQNVYNRMSYFVFKLYTYQSVDYVAIVYRDGYNQGAVIHQILTEDLSMINRALNLNVYDNGQTIYCPDIVCSWNGTCHNTNVPNCRNCPNCPGCQQVRPPVPQIPPYCNQCPYCQGCPMANQGYQNNNNQGGFQFGGSTGLFVLGESAPEGLEDEEAEKTE